MHRTVLPVKKQHSKIAQFQGVPEAYTSDDLCEWQKKLQQLRCYPIDPQHIHVLASFSDESGVDQVQIQNSENNYIACLPSSIAYRVFPMGLIWDQCFDSPMDSSLDNEVNNAAPVDNGVILSQITSRRKAIVCEECDREFTSLQGLSLHVTKTHRFRTERDEGVFKVPKNTRKRRRRITEDAPRIRPHTAYHVFLKRRKETNVEEKDWNLLSKEQKDIFVGMAREFNVRDGFATE